MFTYVLFPAFFVVVACVVYPKTDLEYKQLITKYVVQCNKDHPVELQELFNLEKFIVPKNMDTKCVLACAYRKEGTLTKNGMYDMNHALKVAESVSSGDEKRKKNSLILVNICVKVNDKPVSDGEKGCDRAALIFKCVTENGPKLGFKA